MSVVFVLTKEYVDRSGFSVWGVTSSNAVAAAWVEAGDLGQCQAKAYCVEVDVALNEKEHWTPAHWFRGETKTTKGEQ